jgi:hypothetical protein
LKDTNLKAVNGTKFYDMIKIKNYVLEFDYFTQEEIVGTSLTGSIITDNNFIDGTFPFRQVIGFKNHKGKYIKLDLLGNFYDTMAQSLSWKNFHDNTLEALSQYLHLETKTAFNSTEGDNLIAYFNNTDFIAQIALKKDEDLFYASIFYIRLPDLYRGAGNFEGRLYIKDLCEVELSGEILEKYNTFITNKIIELFQNKLEEMYNDLKIKTYSRPVWQLDGLIPIEMKNKEFDEKANYFIEISKKNDPLFLTITQDLIELKKENCNLKLSDLKSLNLDPRFLESLGFHGKQAELYDEFANKARTLFTLYHTQKISSKRGLKP